MSSTSEKSVSAEAAEHASVGASEPSQPRMNPFAWTALTGGVLCATFLLSLDTTVVATIQPRIVHDLGEIDKLTWISVGFNLGAAGANLCWGKLFGQFENKALFIFAMLLFEVGSAICGAAPTMNSLIVGRVLCGLGGNGLYIGALKILSNLTTIKQRPTYFAYVGVVWGLGIVLGPIIGSAFATNPHTGWRWSFYINICIGAVFAPVYILILPTHHPQPGHTIAQRVKQFDYVGTVLFIGAYTTGIMAISFGGALFAWSSANTIALFVTCGVLLILFVVQQFFTDPARRIFPAHLLHSWENWVFFALTAASITILFLPIYFIPLYFQFVHNYSPLRASIYTLPFICVGVFFVFLNGGIMGSLGYYKLWYLVGSTLAVVGAALMRTISADSKVSHVYGYSILLAGSGAFVQSGIPVLQAKHPPTEIANILAFMSCAQRTGLALGFAIANSVFFNEAVSRITTILPGADLGEVQATVAGATSTLLQNLPSRVKPLVLAALTISIDKVYDVILASACLCLALSLILKNERLFAD